MRSISKTVTQWALTLHIYLSMAGFILILLFAVTGLTLNHADFGWSEPKLTASTLTLPPELLMRPSKESIGDYLATTLGERSPLILYREYPEEIEVQFAAPGKRTHVLINRTENTAEIEVEWRGWLGRLDDLHKGRDSGRVWVWVSDITAILLSISALTGMVTLTSLPARRRNGFIVGAIGLSITVAIYLIFVP